MTCEEALVLLSGHLDHENTAEEEAQLQQHLAACPACRQLLAAFEAVDADLLSLEEEPPADLHANVMQAIRQETAGRKRRRSMWAGLAVAAALTVVIGATALRSAGQGSAASAPQTAMLRTAAAEEVPASAEPAAAETTLEKETVLEEERILEDSDLDRAVVGGPMLFAAAPSEEAAPDSEWMDCDPQELANQRGADVLVTGELLPEMELCPCETLENGALLYQLDTSSAAVELSRLYGAELYQPAQYGTEDLSYALLLPQ